MWVTQERRSCGGGGVGKWPNWSYYLSTCCLCLLFLCPLVNVWRVTSCRPVSSTLMDGGRGRKGGGGLCFKQNTVLLRGHQSHPPDRHLLPPFAFSLVIFV